MKVTLQHLTKAYPSRTKDAPDVLAVNDFCFEIPDGELVGLLGPSACGKSTTLHLLSGLQKPSQGQILFGEDDVTNLPAEHRGVGLVFQNYALYPHLTVYQNIIFPLQSQDCFIKRFRLPKRKAEIINRIPSIGYHRNHYFPDIHSCLTLFYIQI
jgi:multiple sugar transport system ATP-binding protein